MNSILHNAGNVKLSEITIVGLPHHKLKSDKEWSSSCPTCGGEDRFLYWPYEGNYWCRQCGLSGFVDQETQKTLTDDQLADIERRKREARQAEIERKKTVLQRLQTKRPDIIYHQNLNGQAAYVQEKWGLTSSSIKNFKIGYCHACPTSTDSDSITIPYYYRQQLINLRHRLNHPNGGGKYRPEMAGLSTSIFNADVITTDEDHIIIVEGEFKTMVLEQYGLPVIGLPGASNFKEKWVELFPPEKLIYVALDPDAERQGLRIAKMFRAAKIAVRLVCLPVKPDDFFVLHGGTYDQFNAYLQNGRMI